MLEIHNKKNNKLILEWAIVSNSVIEKFQDIRKSIYNCIDHNKYGIDSRTIIFTDGNDSNEKIIKQIDKHINRINDIPRIYFAGENFTDSQIIKILTNIELLKNK